MPSNKPSINIITVNFNGKRYLKRLFDSIYRLNYPKEKLKVIFVDNISIDNSVEFVKGNYPQVEIIKNNFNNYCKAINLGISASRSDYVALVNNDTKVDKNWLTELINVIIKDKSIAAVGSKILTFDGNIQNASHYELPNFYWGERGAGQVKEKFQSIEEAPSLCGAAVLYRKEVFSSVGLFDEDYVIYGEDVDMSLRLRQKGYKLVFVPKSIVYHEFHGTATEEFSRYYIERNRLLFVAKHYPLKLSSSLLGSGYFTVKKSLDYYGKIYSIFPDIIIKLIKTHSLEIANKVIPELFAEIHKFVNYDNDLFSGQIKKACEVSSRAVEDLARKNKELQDKDEEVREYEEQILIKDGQIIEKEAQIRQKAEELLSKGLRAAETGAELNLCKDEISRLAEELATKIVISEENEAYLKEKEAEIKYYREELGIISTQLRQRMDQVLIKDNQILEKDKHIERVILEKDKHIERVILEKDKHIERVKNELNGIYNSEGYRFILYPFWRIMWHIRNLFKALKKKLNHAAWLACSLILMPVFIFLAAAFLLEYIIWILSGFLLKKTVSVRKIKPADSSAVTVVIPNYNGVAYLNECLSSIFSAVGFTDNQNEVLVVDDGSTDGSIDLIKKNFPRVRLVQNRKNMGFGLTCNKGIRLARNETIVLINNDIILTKDFLKPLVDNLKNSEDVFTVTPKLYAWDKKTFAWGMHMGQFEEGHIRLWNEAETGNKDKVKEACPSIFAIGAAMVFRKNDFIWLGGFDSIYRPNCWEDIDLSYCAWKRGLKVLYQPNSLMFHKGRATLSYERHKEIKNELLFTWKNITEFHILKDHLFMLPLNLYKYRMNFLKGLFWALTYLPQALFHRILERRYSAGEKDTKIFDRIMHYYENFAKKGFNHSNNNNKPNVLLISRFMPYPPNTGGKIRINTLIKLLSDRYNFFLLTLIDHEDERKYIPELEKTFKKIYAIVATSTDEMSLNLKMLYPLRYKLGFSYSRKLVEKLEEIQENMPLDLIHIESNELLYLTDHIKRAPIVYTEHDASILTLGASYYRKKGNRILHLPDYLKRFYFHISRLKKLDKIITLSKREQRLLKGFLPQSAIDFAQTGVDLKHFSFESPVARAEKLIFVGHYPHYPNEYAVVHFIKEILPLIRKQVPKVDFLIVGSNPTPSLEKLSKEKNVKLIGTVEDVKPYLNEAAVFVNNIRISGGIKGKVLEAMAAGVPVVSTRMGLYGIEALPEKEVLVGDTPREFSRQVIKLLSDVKLRTEMAVNARRLVEKKYAWFDIAKRIGDIYQNTISPEPANSKSGGQVTIKHILNKVDDLVKRQISQAGDLNRPEEGPQELHIELTYRCNSKCIMCDLWDYKKRYPGADGNELSLDEIRRFTEESSYLTKIKTVVLSGGEPFLRNDIVDICGFFAKHLPDSSIGILTNAIDTETVLTKTKTILEKFQPKSLWLGSSLDGLGQEHDKIRGINGAFSGFCRTIERCRKEIPGVKLSATFTLTPYNINQLIPAKQFADKQGLGFFAQFAVEKSVREKFNWKESDLMQIKSYVSQITEGIIEGRDYTQFLHSLGNSRDNWLIAQLYYWSHFVDYQAVRERLFKKCIAGSRFAMFTPEGDLFFCPILKEQKAGNIRQEKFDELWMSKKSNEFRCFVEKGTCHCWLVCIIFPLLDQVFNRR